MEAMEEQWQGLSDPDPGDWWLDVMCTSMPLDVIAHVLVFLQMHTALNLVANSSRLRRELGNAIKRIMFNRVAPEEQGHQFKPLEMQRVSLAALRHELLNFLRFTSPEFLMSDRQPMFPISSMAHTYHTRE